MHMFVNAPGGASLSWHPRSLLPTHSFFSKEPYTSLDILCLPHKVILPCVPPGPGRTEDCVRAHTFARKGASRASWP